MLQMGNLKVQRQLIAQTMQNMQQGHGVRPTGYGNQNTVAGIEHRLLLGPSRQ
jgi:hypothetical protein